jgi:hypothetical protein
MGNSPLRWADLPKSEAIIGNQRCGPRSRGCDNPASCDHVKLTRVLGGAGIHPALSRPGLGLVHDSWTPGLQRSISLALMLRSARHTIPAMTSRSRGMFSPELCKFVVPLQEQREQGMPGARCTRGLVCKLRKQRRTRAYRAAENTPTSPAQWLYGLYRALPGERACCHRHRQHTCCRLEASIAASGPHDFAVRFGVFVRRAHARLTPKRPPHPIPTCGDDGQRPSSGMRRRRL